MRIFGGHDYYDCGLALGRDPSITLIRENTKIAAREAGIGLLDEKVILYAKSLGNESINLAVAFCTKIYRGVAIPHLDGQEGFWSAAKLRRWSEARKFRITVASRGWHPEGGITLEEYFTPYPAPPDVRDWMIANKYSILVQQEALGLHEETISVNPTGLKQLGFASALDPYTAFQELSMWISGVLGGTSPDIVRIVDDKTLIESHGFDPRFSFRGPRLK